MRHLVDWQSSLQPQTGGILNIPANYQRILPCFLRAEARQMAM